MLLVEVDREVLLSLWPVRRLVIGASTCHLLRSILSKAPIVRLDLKSTVADDRLEGDSLAGLFSLFSGTVLLSFPLTGCAKVLGSACAAMRGGWNGLCGLDVVSTESSQVPSTFYADLQCSFELCHALKCISLYESHLGVDGAEKFGAALERLDGSHLIELELGGNCIQDRGVTCLSQALLRCNATRLEHLRLSRNEITERGAVQLAQVLHHMVGIQELVLGRNRISDDGMSTLAHVLRGLPSLTYIDLGGNRVGSNGAEWLAELGKPSATTQNGCNASNNGSVTSIHGTCCLSSLTALDLSYNRLGPGAKHLRVTLGQCRGLTDLDLSGNEFGEEKGGMAAVCAVVGCSPRLANLCLGGTKMGDAGAGQLAVALEGVTALRNLSVNSNAISDRGMSVLLAALELVASSSLETLNLAFNRIQSNGCHDIGHRLSSFRRLTRSRSAFCMLTLGGVRDRVDVSYNWMGPRGSEILAQALQMRWGIAGAPSLLVDGNSTYGASLEALAAQWREYGWSN